MEDNEDEPIDVQIATPVVDEILKGEIDEESSKPRQPYNLTPTTHNKCPKEIKIKKKIKTKDECCDSKWKNRIDTKRKKTGKVIIYEKPCTIEKIPPIPRHCLSKDEWYNLLSRPSKKCPSQPRQIKIIERPLRPVSARMKQLALPPRNRMLATLEDRGSILPPELVDKLIQIIENETCLTPEQAENLIRDKKKKKKKFNNELKDSKINCTSDKINKNEYFIQPSTSQQPQFDDQAVNYQYTMANEFVKSILQWKSQIPREEFSDISDVIIKRLENILDYQIIDDGDRVTQQMKFLSDIIASWIAGVLFEVGEAHKEELEKECEERKNTIDDDSNEDSDDDDDDSEVDIIMEPRPEVLAKLRKEKESRYNKDKDKITDEIKNEIKGEVEDENKEKEEENNEVGDSYSVSKIKEEPKRDDDDDNVGGAGGIQGEATLGQTASDSQQNNNEESKPVEEQTPDEKKGEKTTDNVGVSGLPVDKNKSKNIIFKEEQSNVKQDIKSEVLSKKIKFNGESGAISSVEKTMKENTLIHKSDSIEEIPQEPKVYEIITIDDEPESGDNKVTDELEPVSPVKSVKDESGLLKPNEIKKEKDQVILNDPLLTKIKSEKNIENDLSVVHEIKQEPDFDKLSVSQIKSEKIKKELPELIIQDIKQETNLVGVSLSQIKLEKNKDKLSEFVGQNIKQEVGLEKKISLAQIKSEKVEEIQPELIKPGQIKKELSELVSQNIKQEPGLEKIPLTQIKSEKNEDTQSGLIKPGQIKEELSDLVSKDIKQEPDLVKISLAQIKLEKSKDSKLELIQPEKIKKKLSGVESQDINKKPDLEKLPLTQIKSEKNEDTQSDLIKPGQHKEKLSGLVNQHIEQEAELNKPPTQSQIKSKNIKQELPELTNQQIQQVPVSDGPTMSNIKSEKIDKQIHESLAQDVDKKSPVSNEMSQMKPEYIDDNLSKYNQKNKITEPKISTIKSDKLKQQNDSNKIENIENNKNNLVPVDKKLQQVTYTKLKPEKIKYKSLNSPLSEIKNLSISNNINNNDKYDNKNKILLLNELNDKKNQEKQSITDFSNIFKTDLPFLNYLKLFDTFENIIENEKINNTNDPIIDRLHSAIYKKLENIVNAETPDKLTINIKNMLDILSGKLAIFLRNLLNDSELLYIVNNPGKVESFELRETSKWINNMSNIVNCWSSWLQELVEEAVEISNNPTTRSQWNDWTKKIQNEALLYHRFHIDCIKQANHNRIMLDGRKVVKTGQLNYPEYEIKEREIKTTDLWN